MSAVPTRVGVNRAVVRDRSRAGQPKEIQGRAPSGTTDKSVSITPAGSVTMFTSAHLSGCPPGEELIA
jgi:hypothetical protein